MNQPLPPSSNPQPVRKEGADRLSLVLTATLCTLLGVNLLVMSFGKSGPASASAQVAGYTNTTGNPINMPPPSGVVPNPENIPSAPVSSPELLKRVIEQQIETNARLARLESAFAGPHQVTVTNWPPKDAAK